ncbi:MAG: C-terminal binding protein [Chloroflexi bacterium]|nr:C-terminal binding protein [Chloroflexota bacterium]
MSSPRFRAVITDADYPDVAQERAILEGIGAELVREHVKDEAGLIRALAGAEVILTQYAPLTARVLATLDRCKGIVRYGVGFDTVDVPAATKRGIYVCNVPDYGTDEVSDHAITLLLAIARKLIVAAEGVQRGVWSVEPLKPVGRLRGRALGIIGLGRIGSLTAAKAQGFGIRVIAHDPALPASAFAERNVTPVGLDELLQTADYVSIHAPLSAETRHLIGERALRLMKPSAFLINTARGGLVDADALATALRAGEIAGAALDVMETEPIARDSALLGLENCIITPHAAWYSDEAAAALQRLAGEEAARLLLGQAPRCPVNTLS